MKSTEELYLERGFARESGYGKVPAVLVVDVIKGFTDPTSPLGSDYTRLLENLKLLLNVAREKDVPIFFTTVIYYNYLEGGNFIKKVPSLKILTPESEWVQIDPVLNRQENEIVITKKFASSFFGTNLTSLLVEKGIDTLIVTGVTTSGCVRATVVDALQYGYKVIVPEECVGDRAPEPHKANLFDINAKYGDVTKLENVLEYF